MKPEEDTGRRRLNAVWLLRLEAALLGVLPAALVFGPLGGVGSPARVLGILLFGIWACFAFTPGLGVRACVPVRIVLAMTWASALVSYLLLNRHSVAGVEATSADTFLLLLVAYSGVALTAAECLRTRHEIFAVMRSAVWAAGFSAFVAILQFRPGFDLTEFIVKIPLLTTNSTFGNVSSRGGFNRPPGTAVHPIEFSVVTATALAFAIFLLLHDDDRPLWKRRLTFGLIALAIPIAISRSALIVAFVVLAYFILGASKELRARTAIFIAGFGSVIFVFIPGLIGTLTGLVSAGSSDSSISTRTSDYATVARFVRPNPWFGRGGGTFLPSYRILDNQFLLTLVELGIVGVVALIVLFFAVICLGRAARRHARTAADKMLGQMFAAAGMGSLVALATFDAFSFPTFTAFSALWLGLAGGWWRIISTERGGDSVGHDSSDPESVGTVPGNPA